VYRALASLPPETMDGRIKITEQGEIVSQQFGLLPIAERTLEVSLAGTLRLQFADWREGRDAREVERWRAAVDELADRSLRVYRGHVQEDEALFALFREATPVDALADARFGSRPSYRPGAKASIEGIRAIPWVFGWTQMRLMLPGWLGVGSALEAMSESPAGLALLRGMAEGWPFFDDLLGKVEMVCAKADLAIARLYVERLGGDAALLGRLEEEFHRTVRCILRIRETDRLLADNPVLEAAIALRNPYVDPLSLMQVAMLRRQRELEGSDSPARTQVADALATTLSGIAQGLRNTG
jgi:phosphoenolpyruvate carboxylase